MALDTYEIADYIKKFAFSVDVKLGPSYGPKFKEFHDWCSERLGTRYKDWFIVSTGKDTYKLFCRGDKWAMFLTLEHLDKLI